MGKTLYIGDHVRITLPAKFHLPVELKDLIIAMAMTVIECPES